MASLDEYLKKQAWQDVKRRMNRVFVATQPDVPGKVVAYYTLSSLSIELNQLPAGLARKLPRYPIPAALIGRLAVSSETQGQGIGKLLLVNAIKRTLAVSENMGIYAMVVDAINERAEHFYRHFGFARLSTEQRRLFLPLKSIQTEI